MIYVYQIIMQYIWNLHSAVCQLHLNKSGRKRIYTPYVYVFLFLYAAYDIYMVYMYIYIHVPNTYSTYGSKTNGQPFTSYKVSHL